MTPIWLVITSTVGQLVFAAIPLLVVAALLKFLLGGKDD